MRLNAKGAMKLNFAPLCSLDTYPYSPKPSNIVKSFDQISFHTHNSSVEDVMELKLCHSAPREMPFPMVSLFCWNLVSGQKHSYRDVIGMTRVPLNAIPGAHMYMYMYMYVRIHANVKHEVRVINVINVFTAHDLYRT